MFVEDVLYDCQQTLHILNVQCGNVPIFLKAGSLNEALSNT